MQHETAAKSSGEGRMERRKKRKHCAFQPTQNARLSCKLEGEKLTALRQIELTHSHPPQDPRLCQRYAPWW